MRRAKPQGVGGSFLARERGAYVGRIPWREAEVPKVERERVPIVPPLRIYEQVTPMTVMRPDEFIAAVAQRLGIGGESWPNTGAYGLGSSEGNYLFTLPAPLLDVDRAEKCALLFEHFEERHVALWCLKPVGVVLFLSPEDAEYRLQIICRRNAAGAE